MTDAVITTRAKHLAPKANRGHFSMDRAVCRALDLLVASSALLLFLPLMVLVALAIRLQDGGPALFGHKRIGVGGRSFRCWKFRSMVVDADARLAKLLALDPEARREWQVDHKLRNDPRVTQLGHILRITSVDELPQLFNVLAGDMSIVGPRPIVTSEISKYGRWFQRYCAVRPGITGIWQVSGRNDVDYQQRVAMDVLFARKRSAALYLKILLATLPAVLLRRGSY